VLTIEVIGGFLLKRTIFACISVAMGIGFSENRLFQTEPYSRRREGIGRLQDLRQGMAGGVFEPDPAFVFGFGMQSSSGIISGGGDS
jgi:hypothetical protein